MMDFAGFMGAVDGFLIAPYRWVSNPVAGFWLGTAILATLCTLIGELTLSLAQRTNGFLTKELAVEMRRRHEQSLNALRAGNREAYEDINKLAKEAYGRSFFLQVAMGASSLWPVPFALGWMQTRFSDVRMAVPLTGKTVGYTFFFVILYILSRIVLKRLKPPGIFRQATGRTT